MNCFWTLLVGLFLFQPFCSNLFGNSNSEYFIGKDGAVFQLSWSPANALNRTDEEGMKEIFIHSFFTIYRLNNAYIDQSDLAIQESLASDFERIVRPNLHSDKDQLFLAAKRNGKMVGYALFAKIKEDAVYIAELAIAKEDWRKGLGTKMTYAILEKDPKIQKIVLLTEWVNLDSRKFYESLGFSPSNYWEEGYSSEKYCAYEKSFY